MSYTQAIISGIVQGITEFLPVSSSGHLVILHDFFGYKEHDLFFNILLHAGTLVAVFVYFWKDIVNVILEDHKLLLSLIIGSIPAAFIGYFFKDICESLFANIRIVGIMLYVTAILLFLADFAGKMQIRDNRKKSPSLVKAATIGIVQGIAIIPGISRSGATISSGILLKIDKEMAIKFSFLLAIPAILGALALKLFHLKPDIAHWPQMTSGILFAFLFGLGSIYILVKTALKGRLKFFAFYCILMGTAVTIKGFIG